MSVGSPDFCPGCDKNFSLSAREYADRSVSGQWTDRFSGGLGGFHAVIDCLVVDGNVAYVSGVATQGYFRNLETGEVIDLAGLAVGIVVRDNGASENDSADQISYSVFELNEPFALCTEKPDYPHRQKPDISLLKSPHN